jgi:hypothetical protein
MNTRKMALIAAFAVLAGTMLLGPSALVEADASFPLVHGLRSLRFFDSGVMDRIPVHLANPKTTIDIHLTEPVPLDSDYILPASAISSSDKAEPFASGNPRFCKVPCNLAPIYEQAARDFRIPVRYLVANGAYESRFQPQLLGDSGRSCGIHQFHHFRKVAGQRDWSLWGFGSLERCQDPEANIRTVARVWRERMDNTDANYRCNGLLSCAIRLHKGQGALSYMQIVMTGADSYYTFDPAHPSPS